MANVRNHSPLRYPGGKSCLTNFLSDLARINDLTGGVYVEMYAGGAGAALNLLFDGIFDQVHINDFDYSVFATWYCILNRTEDFIHSIEQINVTIEEWYKQRDIYQKSDKAEILDVGLATFFLNRTNRSGIVYKAGPIGGKDQSGNYKIDVRFNKKNLIKRIEKIASYKDKIQLTNLDAVTIINNLRQFHPNLDRLFVYLDPPYYNKGKMLYLNNYNHIDHLNLSESITNLNNVKWLISYDNVPEIKQMYVDYRMSSFDLNYMLQSKKFGSELLIFSDNLIVSEQITVNKRDSDLVLM